MQLMKLKFKPNFQGFKRKQKKVKFQIFQPNATEIFLVGDFNSWDQTSIPLKKNVKGDWETTVKLCSGRYEYKFIIDGEWKIDSNNKDQVSNELGTTNSVITVTI